MKLEGDPGPKLLVDVAGAGTWTNVGSFNTCFLEANALAYNLTSSALVPCTTGPINIQPPAKLSGSFQFLDVVAIRRLNIYLEQVVIMDWQLVVPRAGSLTGLFRVTSLFFDPPGAAVADLCLAASAPLLVIPQTSN